MAASGQNQPVPQAATLPTYLTAAEKAFASKVHIASYAQKSLTAKFTEGPAKDKPIQTFSGVDAGDAAKKTTLYGAMALGTARTKPIWDRAKKAWIDGWKNGTGA